MRNKPLKKVAHKVFPVFFERDEDGMYVVECPVFNGCYTQGKTIDQAMKKIKEVILLCMEEKSAKERAGLYIPSEMGVHAVAI